MPFTGPSILILAFFLTSRIAPSIPMTTTISSTEDSSTTKPPLPTSSPGSSAYMTFSSDTLTSTTLPPSENSSMELNVSKTTLPPADLTDSPPPKTAAPFMTTPTLRTTRGKGDGTAETNSDHILAPVLITVIILAAIILVGICFFSRRRARRYSVDLNSRADDVRVPLSAVEPEASQNGMQTFSRVATEAAEPEAPKAEAGDGSEETPKGEGDGSAAEANGDPPAPASSLASSVEKSEEDKDEEAPGEKTDSKDPQDVKETAGNENNSNNTIAAASGWDPDSFIVVPLDSPFWDC